MKKFLFALPIISLLAAGCNSSTTTQPTTQVTPTPQQQVVQNPAPTAIPTPTQPSSDDTQNWKTYSSAKYEFQIQYPSNWYAYGDKSAFTNPDLLEWKGLVPDYDSKKSFEQQGLLQISVYKNDPNSTFASPKNYIVGDSTQKREKVTVNSYAATKITDIKTNKITTYVFENNDNIYVLNSTDPSFFTTILKTFKFTN